MEFGQGLQESELEWIRDVIQYVLKKAKADSPVAATVTPFLPKNDIRIISMAIAKDASTFAGMRADALLLRLI